MQSRGMSLVSDSRQQYLSWIDRGLSGGRGGSRHATPGSGQSDPLRHGKINRHGEPLSLRVPTGRWPTPSTKEEILPNYILYKADLVPLTLPRDRPARRRSMCEHQIEVTESMARAGVTALDEFSGSYSGRFLVEAIYIAMVRAALAGTPQRDPPGPDQSDHPRP
jgi:hypothetical protein